MALGDNTGVFVLPRHVVQDENLMRQIFSQGMIILGTNHDAIKGEIEYKVDWKYFVITRDGTAPLHYGLQQDVEGGITTYKLNYRTVAKSHSIVAYIKDNQFDSEIYLNGVLIPNVQDFKIQSKPGGTLLTLSVFPDLVCTSSVTTIKDPERKLILDKEKI